MTAKILRAIAMATFFANTISVQSQEPATKYPAPDLEISSLQDLKWVAGKWKLKEPVSSSLEFNGAIEVNAADFECIVYEQEQSFLFKFSASGSAGLFGKNEPFRKNGAMHYRLDRSTGRFVQVWKNDRSGEWERINERDSRVDLYRNKDGTVLLQTKEFRIGLNRDTEMIFSVTAKYGLSVGVELVKQQEGNSDN